MIQCATINMVGSAGVTFTFTEAVSAISILSRADCWVQFVHTGGSLVAPVANPSPAAGASALYRQIKANEEFSLEINLTNGRLSTNNQIIGIIGWAEGSGNLVMTGWSWT